MLIPVEMLWNRLSNSGNISADEYARPEPVDALPEQLPSQAGQTTDDSRTAEAPSKKPARWDASQGDRRNQQRRERSLPTPLDTRIQDRRRPPGAYPTIRCKI